MKEPNNHLKLLYIIIPLFILFFVGVVFSASISYSPTVSKANSTPEISSSKISRTPRIFPSVQRDYVDVLLPPEVKDAKAYFKNVTPKNRDDSYSSVENTWATCSSQGYKKIPVFLVEFSDYPHLSNLTVSDYEDMFNSDNYLDGNAQSVSTYYNIASNSALDLEFDIYDWREVQNPYSFYIQNNTNAFALILHTVDVFSDVDFSQYDNDNDGRIDGMIIIHAAVSAQSQSGNLLDSTRIFSGSTNYSVQGLYYGNTATIGSHYPENICSAYRSVAGYYPEDCRTKIQVAVHEFAHILGLPDLYGISPEGNQHNMGLLYLSVMTDIVADRSRPISFDPWSKYFLGWANVTSVIDSYGIFNLDSLADTHDIYKLQDTSTQYSNEFFLVSNRYISSTNQDKWLLHGLIGNALNPTGGLDIYHIDEDYIQSHYAGEVCFNCIMYDEDMNFFNDDISHPGIIFEQNLLDNTDMIPPISPGDLYTNKYDDLAGMPWGVFDNISRDYIPNLIDLPWDSTSNTYNGLVDTEVKVWALSGDNYTLKAYLQSKVPNNNLTSEILSPENNQTFYTDQSISFQGTYDYNIGTANCKWYKNYSTNPVLINSNCTFDMQASQFGGVDLTQDITLKVTDELEQESISEVTITILQAPIFAITILNPISGETYSHSLPIMFTSSYVNNNGSVSCEWKDETQQLLSTDCNFSLVPDDFGWGYPTDYLLTKSIFVNQPFADKILPQSIILFNPNFITYPHTITLTAQDSSDQMSSTSVDILISPLDFIGPNFNIMSPI
ncbi:M6 family metalloprotease domain-containing protein [archaeon]|nr:M6 family metalloprotease domain-containing protein [archaeon]